MAKIMSNIDLAKFIKAFLKSWNLNISRNIFSVFEIFSNFRN